MTPEERLADFRGHWINALAVRITRFLLIAADLVGKVIYVKSDYDQRVQTFRRKEKLLELGRRSLERGDIDRTTFFDIYQMPYIAAGINLFGEEVSD